MSGRFGPFARRAAGFVAVVAVLALAVSACGSAMPTSAPLFTSVPIGPTPWPNGTTGQYGLRIDPSLLRRLPIAVGGVALTEDAGTETVVLDDPDIAKTVQSFAAAMAGDILSTDFVGVEILQFKPEDQTPDAYASWIDSFAFQACSQSDGVGDSSTETIGSWTVDVSACNGGVNVYSLSLGNGQYLSAFGNGPKDLGRLLIANLH